MEGEKRMKHQKIYFSRNALIFIFVPLLFSLFAHVPMASAIPSYARQTGFPCKSCHYMPPELTPLGRAFKLNGYTMTGKPTVTSPGKGNTSGLNILESFPLAVLFDTSFTSLKSPEQVPQSGGGTVSSQNGSFEFPQQASLFLAGAWATHVGSFVQVTYTSQGDHFSWDNSDIRYANATHLFKKDLAYGITLNNNPTMEDLWNSTPAWGFPWVGSDWAPTPNAAAIINGVLAQDVAGVGGCTPCGTTICIWPERSTAPRILAPRCPIPVWEPALIFVEWPHTGDSPGSKTRRITTSRWAPTECIWSPRLKPLPGSKIATPTGPWIFRTT